SALAVEYHGHIHSPCSLVAISPETIISTTLSDARTPLAPSYSPSTETNSVTPTPVSWQLVTPPGSVTVGTMPLTRSDTVQPSGAGTLLQAAEAMRSTDHIDASESCT